MTFENYWHNLKLDREKFYNTGIPKRKVLVWYSLVFNGISTIENCFK
jgi:hypothetical protein